jgi:multiple sugar transport system ATP-binding protein
MANRIAVMRGGKLEAYDTPSELYQRPQTRFVAAFIGHPPMNLLPATIGRSNGHMAVQFAGAELAIPPPLVQRLDGDSGAGRDVLLGIRPEDVLPSADGQLVGEVDLVEPLGRDDLLSIRSGDTQINALAPAAARIASGSQVRLKVDPERIHLFDPATDSSLLWR